MTRMYKYLVHNILTCLKLSQISYSVRRNLASICTVFNENFFNTIIQGRIDFFFCDKLVNNDFADGGRDIETDKNSILLFDSKLEKCLFMRICWKH